MHFLVALDRSIIINLMYVISAERCMIKQIVRKRIRSQTPLLLCGAVSQRAREERDQLHSNWPKKAFRNRIPDPSHSSPYLNGPDQVGGAGSQQVTLPCQLTMPRLPLPKRSQGMPKAFAIPGGAMLGESCRWSDGTDGALRGSPTHDNALSMPGIPCR
jgi:hypothetical protein